MTLGSESFSASVSSVVVASKQENNSLPSLTDVLKGPSGPRFNLRKRSVADKPEVNLSSYNSAFLSGLFADVARVATTSASNSTIHVSDDNSNNNSNDDDDDYEEEQQFLEELRQDDTASIKRSRVSLSRSISRCGRSFANLRASMTSPVSPLTPMEFFSVPDASHKVFLQEGVSDPANDCDALLLLDRENSLTFQLHCVSSGSSSSCDDERGTTTNVNVTSHVNRSNNNSNNSNNNVAVDIGLIAFPHLPATVSDSSCTSSLSPGKADQHVSAPDASPLASSKEAYGWFVEMEDDDDNNINNLSNLDHTTNRITAITTLRDGCSTTLERIGVPELAFSAATAPKQVNYDAEVEWAKAADTVDDVLGDFF